jgi:hypothetical protein
MLRRLRRGRSGQDISEIGDRIAYLCALLAESDLPADGEMAAKTRLERITALVREKRWDEDELARVLDELDKAMAAANYGHLTRPTRKYQQLPGDDRPRQIDVLVCPAPHRCARAVRATDADDATCAITGQALKKIRLTS